MRFIPKGPYAAVTRALVCFTITSLPAQFRWERVRSPFVSWQYSVYNEDVGRLWAMSLEDIRSSVANICEWDGFRWIPRHANLDPRMGALFPGLVFDPVNKTLLYLDGEQYLTYPGATWLWLDGRWVKQNPGNSPKPRYAAYLAHDRKRNLVVLHGGCDGKQVFNDTWEWDGKDWREIKAAQPPLPTGNLYYTITWDVTAGKVAFWNGTLWHWDGANWSQAANSKGPALGAIASDPIRKRLMLLEDYGDLWEWDGQAWSKTNQGLVKPPTRRSHKLFWDTRRSRLILLGGYSKGVGEDGGGFNDLWEWDGKKWEERLSGHALPIRFDCKLAYDSVRRRAVMLGGAYKNVNYSKLLSQTWEWDGVGWHATRPKNHPRMGLMAPSMAFDPLRGRTVVFGGVVDGAGGGYVGETWEWDGKDWQQFLPVVRPPLRFNGYGCYFPPGKVSLFVGGEGPTSFLNDTWEWDGKSWRERKPANRPPGAGFLSYNPHTKKIVLPEWEKFWEWDGNDWSVTVTTGFPKNFYGWGGVYYDPHRNQYFAPLYIGPSSANLKVEVWLCDGKKWWPGTTTGEVISPRFFRSTRCVYDPYRQELILPCGYSMRSTYILRWDDFRVTPEVALGGKARFDLALPAQANRIYLSLLSTATHPAISIPGLPDLPLGPSPLLSASLLLPGAIGLLDSQGKAGWDLPIPADPALRGLWLQAGALTLDLTGQITHVTPRQGIYLY